MQHLPLNDISLGVGERFECDLQNDLIVRLRLYRTEVLRVKGAE